MVGAVSHDLRTPLNCTILSLELAEKKTLEIPIKIIKKYISPALNSSHYMLSLVT